MKADLLANRGHDGGGPELAGDSHGDGAELVPFVNHTKPQRQWARVEIGGHLARRTHSLNQDRDLVEGLRGRQIAVHDDHDLGQIASAPHAPRHHRRERRERQNPGNAAEGSDHE